MIFESDDAAVEYVKLNSTQTPDWVKKAREYSKTLCALIEGEGFADELINQIEHLESQAKATARNKYSRDLRDLFTRLSSPIQNVFSAIGAVKDYQNGEFKMSEANLKTLLNTINNIRDGKSLERYIENKWMPLYHTDPSGVQFVQYIVKPELKVYPTYQAIGTIRNYIPNGQLVENILFEPITIADGVKVWVLVDDAKQYTVLEYRETFTLDTDKTKTFEHPFGTCPVIINSDITDKYGNRLSPIHNVVPAAKEYARDLSIKTIYKFLQGFPKHWRREMICANCHGTRKDGDKVCGTCSPTGKTGKADVTDVAVLPFNPDLPNTINGNDVMGYVSPDLETWKQFNDELDRSENSIYESMWGVQNKSKVDGVKTATEIHYDLQPQIQKLNKYADQAEWIEWTITEWCANIIDLTKPKDEQISLIVYGRRYILEGVDTIQKKYEDAKLAGENAVVLDGIFDELLTVKFKNDVEWMKLELKKAQCEPFLHYSPKEIFDYFGQNEVARKVYFQPWWKNLTDSDLQLDIKVLQAKFDKDFLVYLQMMKLVQPIINPPLN